MRNSKGALWVNSKEGSNKSAPQLKKGPEKEPFMLGSHLGQGFADPVVSFMSRSEQMSLFIHFTKSPGDAHIKLH